MRQIEIRNAILDLLCAKGAGAKSASAIAAELGLKGKDSKKIQKTLTKMAVSGAIKSTGRHHYSAGTPENLIEGLLKVNRGGDGFVITDDDRDDIYVGKLSLGSALSGDRVLVRLNQGGAPSRPARGARRGPRRSAGRIVRIVERASGKLVGTLHRKGSSWSLEVIGSTRRFHVRDPKGAKAGVRVVAEMQESEARGGDPEVVVIEVLGSPNDPTLDTITLMRHYNYSAEFPAAVMRDAETALRRMDEPGERMDCRDMFIFTVDPETARDFDDAISIEKDDDGNRVLGVHIADVAHFVVKGSKLDKEARRRGNSVYFPDNVVPMLPEDLSNGMCSLKPDEDRLAFSVFMTLDKNCVPIRSKCAKTIIRSKLRYTYRQALGLLDPESGAPTHPNMTKKAATKLRQVHEIATALRKRRFDNHALELDVPEFEVVIGKDHRVKDIVPREHDISHQMIEECMILANEMVDTQLSRANRQLIHRIHAEPAPDRIDDLINKLREMGMQPGDLSQRNILASFLRSVQKHPLKNIARIAVLRSMSKAVYSPEAKGHYGLGKGLYAHFTSPIRRYPDLVVHRILAASLDKKSGGYSGGDLASISSHCSVTEQKAAEAERALVETKKYRLLEMEMRRQKPRAWPATVVEVAEFGMFVELDDLQLRGLVPSDTMGRDRGRQRRQPRGRALRQAQGRGGKKKVGLGSKIKVIIAKVDFQKRRLDFAMA